MSIECSFIEEYYSILSKEFPMFLYDYIATPIVQRLKGIGMHCGTDYTKLFQNKCFYSRLDHSIAVALILWNFTKDKKQTIAGLLHDVSTPAFAHVIDFLKKDYVKQEATEELNKEMIRNSLELRKLLRRDHILLEEVDDYKKYTLADNDLPCLSADRLEYMFSSGMIMKPYAWTLDRIKVVYEDIIIQYNELKRQELGFCSQKVAEEFVENSLVVSYIYQSSENKFALQFLADILQYSIKSNILKEKDLYVLSEKDILKCMKHSNNKKIILLIHTYEQLEVVYRSNQNKEDMYCVSFDVKKRYIVPLVSWNNTNKRIIQTSKKIQNSLQQFENYCDSKYIYIEIQNFL